MADEAKPTAAPTTEVGVPAAIGVYPPAMGLVPWRSILEDRERAPDLIWPRSVETYALMQNDAQVKGLLMATTLPIRRYRWEIDPNGAKPEVVDHIAASLNLPVRGEPDTRTKRRTRGRFNHDKHLAHALAALAYGHMYFEQVYEIGDDGLAHLIKLGTRPPRTITDFILDEHGELEAIRQMVIGDIATGLGGRILERSRLLPYVWDSQDDADWIGRSMLRACHPNWAIKDRLIRVDATKHERNAMGIPWFEVTDSSNPQVAELAKIAAEIRAGEYTGGAGPGKLRIAGVEGILPDTIGSVRYHDEQMAKAFCLLFFNLGTTKTGSRSLGSEFVDWYADLQAGIADWYADTTNAYQIEDEVELNWGPDEQPPRLAYTQLESSSLAIQDMERLVKVGLLAVTPDLQAAIAERYGFPAPTAQAVIPKGLPSGDEGDELEEGEEEGDEQEPTEEALPGTLPKGGNGKVTVEEHTRTMPGKGSGPPKARAARLGRR